MKPHFSLLAFAVLALLATVAAFAVASPASAAATITVTTEADEFDEEDSGASCSLREAIQSANENADFGGCQSTGTYGLDDVIRLPNGVYHIEIEGARVHATISLTSPFCPVASQIVEDAKNAISAVEGVEEAEVSLSFDPPWTPERISPLIRSSLGL